MQKKIMIVDDNEQHRALMKIRINKAKIDSDIVMASNGEEALAMVKDESPDLIILDTLLGDMEGFEVCEKVREEFTSDQCKIIIITGVIDAVDAMKARSVGADDYCVKTGDLNYLLDSIRKVLED